MENIPSSLSLSVGWGFFPSLSRSRFISHTISLSLSLSLSFLNPFDAALQLLLCGVRSSSITLTSRCFNWLAKPWLASDKANRSTVVRATRPTLVGYVCNSFTAANSEHHFQSLVKPAGKNKN